MPGGLLTDDNPFPAIHGRVCYHPCEDACNRAELDSPVSVHAYLLAGADVVMTTSALPRHGPGYAAELLDGLHGWMARKGFTAAEQARGLLSAGAGHAVPARVGYLSALQQATRTFG